MAGEPIGRCLRCDTPILAEHPYGWCSKCGEPLPDSLKGKLQRNFAASGRTSGLGRHSNVLHRYKDGYRVAASIIAFGTVIKVIGAILGCVVALILLSQLGDLGAIVIGGFVALAFWVAGVHVTAQGQMLRASLDTAVHGSPFLDEHQKADVMGIAFQEREVESGAVAGNAGPVA